METNTELKMIHLSEVESQQIKWLWYPFIPYGKLSIVQGDPGDGKSTLILNIAAKLSMGECIDENTDLQIQSSQDLKQQMQTVAEYQS